MGNTWPLARRKKPIRRVEEFLIDEDVDVGDYQRWLDSLPLANFLEAMHAELNGEVPEGYLQQMNLFDKNGEVCENG